MMASTGVVATLISHERTNGIAIGMRVLCISSTRGTMARLRPDGQVVRHATATRLSPVRFRLGPRYTPVQFRAGVPHTGQ